jgi:isocitrate lyase
MSTPLSPAQALALSWETNPRWQGIRRDYTPDDVLRLRPNLLVEHSIARHTANRLWNDLHTKPFVGSLGTLTGAQATQMVKAGLQALYLSGWQVAADANLSQNTYPDQSLYPSNSVPSLVRRLNSALTRADQIAASEGDRSTDWLVPIVADAEAGFGGPLHAFELMKSMIEAGAAGVHFEDQLAAEKKCGHLGGKVLVPTSHFLKILKAARLAADVLDIPTLTIARTDALSASLITSDIDPIDQPFLTGERTSEGYFRVKCGLEPVLARSLAYAPYADLLWFETSTPDLGEAREYAQEVRKHFPNKLLAYNCSPSFNWSKHLDKDTIARFSETLAELGYKFQFITLAGWHLINYHTFDLAYAYSRNHMPAYVNLQNQEFARAADGYTAVKHQREVGTAYFDRVLLTISGSESATSALKDSTEHHQF